MTMTRPDDDATIDRTDAPAKGGDMLLVAGDGRLFAHVFATDSVVIGRAPDCDFMIDHPALSRRHAMVRRIPALTVQDLGSTNGTRLSRGLIRGGKAVSL